MRARLWLLQREREQEQARVFAQILDACLSVPECTTYQAWGWTDRFSWRDEGEASGWLAADQEALMFDAAYEPKEAAFAMERTLRAHSETTARMETSVAPSSGSR
mmetsp:Transcript_2440/g.6950  ORF Transcript_2440/g.6950 Transcript_2440/m.6950 type:complete len:105 (+) Transcript_2440:936-1250(+)